MKNLSVFEISVLQIIKKIPRGKVSTYKQIAQALNRPGASRAVGNALNKNPYIHKVPCHRVVKSNGEIGGFALGKEKKIKYLNEEGIVIKNGMVENFSEILYIFNMKLIIN